MAAMMMRIPVAAVCDGCAAVLEAAYDVSLSQAADGKGRLGGEYRHIRSDFSGYLKEQGWVVCGDRCCCPECVEREGLSASMPTDAYSLLREAGQLLRSGRPAFFDKKRAGSAADYPMQGEDPEGDLR